MIINSRRLPILPILSVASALLAGCATPSATPEGKSTFVYGAFELKLEANELYGAKIFEAEDVAIKFEDGALLAPIVITHLTQELPESFDLRSLPAVMLKRAQPEGLSAVQQQELFNTREAMMLDYSGSDVHEASLGSLQSWQTCSSRRCITFLTSSQQDEQILMVLSEDIDPVKILTMVKER